MSSNCDFSTDAGRQACAGDLGAAVGQFLQQNACGKICNNGQVVFERPCAPGVQGIIIGDCAPKTPVQRAQETTKRGLDRYLDALGDLDPVALIGTGIAIFVLYKVAK